MDYRDVFDPTGRVGEGQVSLCQSFESLPPPDDDEGWVDLSLSAYKRALDIYSHIVGTVLDDDRDDCEGSSTSIFEDVPELAALRDLVVVPAVNSGYALIQASGLRALGLCSLGHLETAKGYLRLFIDFLTVSQDEGCQVLALKVNSSMAGLLSRINQSFDSDPI